MNPQQTPQIFTEVFPVQTQFLPTLSAYRLQIRGGGTATVGGKLSYRLRREFQGHWVWAGDRVVTDAPRSTVEIMKVVEELWNEQPDTFKGLQAVEDDKNWKPSIQVQADFVARGLVADVDADIRRVLSDKGQDLGNARVERVYEARGWVVQGNPGVSISISSRLIHKQDLKTFASNIADSEELIGLWVADKTSSLKGEIVEIAGDLHTHRLRLLAITQREEMQEIIGNAPDDELVVTVLAGQNHYDYVSSALRIIVRNDDFRRFKINARGATNALRLEPTYRSELIGPISGIIKQKGWLGDAYGSGRTPNLFLSAADVGFKPSISFGGNQVPQYDEKAILRSRPETSPHF